MHITHGFGGRPAQLTPTDGGAEDPANGEEQLAESMNKLLKALAADGDTHQADRDTFLQMMRAAAYADSPCDANSPGANASPWAVPTSDVFDLTTFARRVLAEYARYTRDRSVANATPPSPLQAG